MINWFNMPAEGMSNGGLFEVKELNVTENGTYEQSGEMYNKVTVNVEGGGGGGDYIVELQTINIPARSVTGVYDAEAQFYIGLEEITDANAAVLDDYSYSENLKYNKFIKVDNAVNIYDSGVTLDTTGFPEDIFSATLILNEENKWVVEITGESAFTVTLNPQTVIVYRPTEDVANYFKDNAVLV